jgi:hypothetical protein
MKLLPLLFVFPLVAHATPGTLMDSNFPRMSAHATVTDAAVAVDGAVFLTGDFVEIDGVPRPGIAKLAADGRLDESFAPLPLGSADSQGWLSFPRLNSPALFALPAGRVMALGVDSWKLLDADGRLNDSLLDDLPRSGSGMPRPQCLMEDRVLMITDEVPILRAYRVADLQPDPSFTAVAGPLPPFQVVPAAAGKLWVLGRSATHEPGFIQPFNANFALYRLEETGSLDLTFPPRQLPEETWYTLQAAAGGGFRLTSEWGGRYQFWPAATQRSLTSRRYDATGVELESLNLALPLGVSSTVIFQHPDLAIHGGFSGTSLVRRQPGSLLPDPTFFAPMAGPQSPILGPPDVTSLIGMNDDKILLGGTRRLLSDGSADPAWHMSRLSKFATVSDLVRLADGSTWVLGNFDLVDGSPAPGLVKLRPDDTPDPSFRPTFDFRFAKKIRVLPDATWLALFTIPVVDSIGAQSQLARFSSSGEFISLWPLPEPQGSAVFSYGEMTDFAIQSDGTTLVTTVQNSEVRTVGFRRIQPDGSTQTQPGSSLGFEAGGALLILDDDSYLRGTTRFAADGTLIGTISGIEEANPAVQLPDRSVIFARPFRGSSGPYLQRWHPLTGVDTAFSDPFKATANLQITGVSAAAHGKGLVRGDLGLAALVRLHATGQLDPTFRPPPGIVNAALMEPNGSVLIGGNFEEFDGHPRSPMARLADTRAVGFNEWIAAATARSGLTAADLLATADPDQDGSSNLLEYAAASDPATPDSFRSQPQSVAPFSWMIPANPEAPEIIRRLETTANLRHWQPARADQIRLETQRASFTWTLLPGSTSLFSRVRVE